MTKRVFETNLDYMAKRPFLRSAKRMRDGVVCLQRRNTTIESQMRLPKNEVNRPS